MSSQKSQSLRRSQFIFTYGPGAILESKNGPRLIPSFMNGLGKNTRYIENFEIEDDRLPQYLREYFSSLPSVKDGADEYRIFALPSNAGIGKTESEVVYRTSVFPRWHICYNTEHHKSPYPVLHDKRKCPECGKPFTENHGTVRFVLACQNGHLDDIDWIEAVHEPSHSSCYPGYLYWISEGSSLGSIRIQCPDCHADTNMQTIYSRRPQCKGRKPEIESTGDPNPAYWTEPLYNHKCNLKMQVIQRQSTSLRVADTVTMLTIPPKKSRIVRILEKPAVIVAVQTLFSIEIDDAADFVKFLQKNQALTESQKQEITSYIEEHGLEKFKKLVDEVQGHGTKTFTELLLDEFYSLRNSGETPGTGSTDYFEMESGRYQDCHNQNFILPFTLYPINLIRTVTVQTGYRRLVSSNTGNLTSYPIPVFATLRNRDNSRTKWCPGFEGFGEALFLYFSPETLAKIHPGQAYSKWQQYIASLSKQEESAIYNQWGDFCHHPEFVWLHTLSHALIRAMAEFTGYSAASIRERVYYSKEGDGGILLYNTTPGSDGGLGGLKDLADSFEEILKRTEENLRFCSNDPLCINGNVQDGTKPNGAACYSCLLIAETSCEHGNRWLDQSLFLEGGE